MPHFEEPQGFSYRLMRRFADSHNNTHNYAALHARNWLFGIVLMIGVAYLAWCADFEVLYQIEFHHTHNEEDAWLKAFVASTIIQILILVNGSTAVKILINGLLGDPEHRVQFYINGTLFVLGFAATVGLSIQTQQHATKQLDHFVEAAKYHQLAEDHGVDSRLSNSVSDSGHAENTLPVDASTRDMEHAKALLFDALSKETEYNATLMSYRNVILNLLAFLLCVGTLYFARGANNQLNRQLSADADDMFDLEGSVEGFEEGGEDRINRDGYNQQDDNFNENYRDVAY